MWFAVARSGVIGGFEDQRDWSLLYIELPGMVAGFPLIALLTWSLTRAVFRGRGRREEVALTLMPWVKLRPSREDSALMLPL